MSRQMKLHPTYYLYLGIVHSPGRPPMGGWRKVTRIGIGHP
jgi:hypothetical protein